MVNRKATSPRSGFTLVEVIVSMILSGIIFTGIMATSTITLGRIATNLRVENDERQMDRAQLEISYFLSRAGEYRIYPNRVAAGGSGGESDLGDYMECWLQEDPLETLPITKVAFSFEPESGTTGPFKLTVSVTDKAGAAKTYTYSYGLQRPSTGGKFFSRASNGFVHYSWVLDSGYGRESFSNMAIPRASL